MQRSNRPDPINLAVALCGLMISFILFFAATQPPMQTLLLWLLSLQICTLGLLVFILLLRVDAD